VVGDISVGEFKRGLRDEAMLGLEQLASASGDNWWKELLRRWTPSGCGEGLRLAIRSNTLDFYHRGNCLAHVAFKQGRRGEPASAYVKCHVQYIFQGEVAGQKQAVFDAQDGLWRHEGFAKRRSFDQILHYIQNWKGDFTPKRKRRKPSEKAGVDAIVGSSQNVIDLEMALPAWEKQKSALRMDLVSLEQAGNKVQIAFWEAKTFDDKRLRGKEKEPEVIVQLLGDGDERPGYVGYVKYDDHEATIKRAYAATCFIITRFHEMKRSIVGGSASPSTLHPLVIEVAQLAYLPEEQIQEKLIVKSLPSLVVYSDGGKIIAKDTSWRRHEVAIRARAIEILIEQNSKDIILPDVTREQRGYSASLSG
jgi:hypothetical protein